MKLAFLLLSLSFIIHFSARSQTTPGPAEKQMTDSICSCISQLDFDNITTKERAEKAFEDCFAKQAGLLLQVTVERKIEFSDHAAMSELGIGIAKNLMAQNCDGFMQLSLAMAKDGLEENLTGVTAGRLKRVELKEFNHFVINDNDNKERTFIWLRQFPGSENFFDGTQKYIGKNLKVNWQEIEVFIPSAKNYYKVKEVTGIEVVQ